MVQKSGQSYSPCVEIDGEVLADVSGEELEAYLLKAGLAQPSDVPTSAPIHCGCSAHDRA
jgi:monothiol glutaredoxin